MDGRLLIWNDCLLVLLTDSSRMNDRKRCHLCKHTCSSLPLSLKRTNPSPGYWSQSSSFRKRKKSRKTRGQVGLTSLILSIASVITWSMCSFSVSSNASLDTSFSTSSVTLFIISTIIWSIGVLVVVRSMSVSTRSSKSGWWNCLRCARYDFFRLLENTHPLHWYSPRSREKPIKKNVLV